jgi:SAM-dependent methyltransferase
MRPSADGDKCCPLIPHSEACSSRCHDFGRAESRTDDATVPVREDAFAHGDAFNPQSMIHFAPEPALSSHIRQKNLFACYATADKNMPGADFHVDLQDLPFEDKSYDFFICSHVLEHVPDDRKALRDLYRITWPGGCGLLMAPVCMEIKKPWKTPPDR